MYECIYQYLFGIQFNFFTKTLLYVIYHCYINIKWQNNKTKIIV